MKVLLLGATGMLGQSLVRLFKKKNVTVHGVARNNTDFNLDVSIDIKKVKQLIADGKYDVVINTTALINLQYCEEHPAQAYMINTYVPGEISKICDKTNTYFIQISTDHYYEGDNEQLHSEESIIKISNEYARTKYLGEYLTLMYKNTLVIRTNIVGFRHKQIPTFVEWILNSLENDQVIFGYKDMYTSSIDVDSFSKILYELIVNHQTGLINVAADGALSKYEFILKLAKKLDKQSLVKKGFLPNTCVKRGNSLGLNIEKLKQSYPNLTIPTVSEVIENIYHQYISNKKEENYK